MDRNEFLQRAMIAVGAALVKCYDEKCDGIIGNEMYRDDLAYEARLIAKHLEYHADDLMLFD